MAGYDVQVRCFMAVVDDILTPNGVKVGGFPEDVFTSIAEEERQLWLCNICFMIVNDARECDNSHLFCRTCIFAWSLTSGENSQKCPFCRNNQASYRENKEVTRRIQEKEARCPEENCGFQAPLKWLKWHQHCRQRYDSGMMDLERLRPARRTGLQFQNDLGREIEVGLMLSTLSSMRLRIEEVGRSAERRAERRAIGGYISRIILLMDTSDEIEEEDNSVIWSAGQLSPTEATPTVSTTPLSAEVAIVPPPIAISRPSRIPIAVRRCATSRAAAIVPQPIAVSRPSRIPVAVRRCATIREDAAIVPQPIAVSRPSRISLAVRRGVMIRPAIVPPANPVSRLRRIPIPVRLGVHSTVVTGSRL